MAISAPSTKPEISRAGTPWRAEEDGRSDFEATVLQAAWLGIFHQRPEKESLAKRFCKKQAEPTRSALLLTLL